MAAMKFHAKVAEDGKLHVPVPGLLPGSNVEVEVLSPKSTSTEIDERQRMIEFEREFYGCIQDEAFVAPVRSMPRPVPPLDAE